MTLSEIRYQVRQRCGISANEVDVTDIDGHIQTSLVWLAAELKYDIHETEIPLVADQFSYQLPASFAIALWCAWHGDRLTATSTAEWNRDHSVWTATPAGTPTAYAVEHRELILLPPPNAAALVTDPTVTLRWIGSGTDTLGAGGPSGLAETEQVMAAWKAAIYWLIDHPTEGNNLKIQNIQSQINEMMVTAKRREHQPIDEAYPSFRPNTTGRRSGAR